MHDAVLSDSSRENGMLRQLMVGAAVSGCNIVILALVMTVVIRVTRTVEVKRTWHPGLFLVAIMVAIVSVLMTAHAFEVIV